MRRAGMGVVAALLAAGAAAAAQPEVTGVEPGRDATHLTCAVATAHLPGERISSSLASGLPSAIEMDVDVFDDRDRVVGGSRIYLRVAFDLWEEVYRLEGAGEPRRFPDLGALRGYLAHIPHLPVSSLHGLRISERHRIRVGMHLHPIASRETERLGQWMAGDGRAKDEGETVDPDGREVSVSLGRLIRFFYKSARREGEAESERFSAWFVPGDLEPEREHVANPN